MSDTPICTLLRDREVFVGAGPAPRDAYQITCNQDVVFRAPWEKIQFHSYDSHISGSSVITVAHEFDFARQQHFTVTHTYGPDSATTEIDGVQFEAVPARLLADGFTPWALLTHQCLSLHAASVLLNDELVILSGYHDAGKSTAARHLAAHEDATLISDDSLILQFDGDEVFASAAFWEEGCEQTPTRTSRVTFALIDDNSGEFQQFGPTMATAQFVGGLYTSEDCFDAGIDLVSRLLEQASFHVLPHHPSKQTLADLAGIGSTR